MGDNQLGILIQAKIDEASKDTIQRQLTQLAKNLKAVKISLDLGDVKAQFAKMFQEIEKESQKASTTKATSTGKTSGVASTDLSKVVEQAGKLETRMDAVREAVKGMGELTGLSEEFSSVDGKLVKMTATIKDFDGTIQTIKNVNVFGKFNEETQQMEYQLGKVKIQAKDFGEALNLATAGKGAGYEKLYNSLLQFIQGGENATKVANDLHNAIYYKNGNQKPFFQKLDASVQNEYLTALQQARAQEAEMDKIHYQALQMNKQQDNARMDALHKEALAMNKKYDQEQAKLQKEVEALEKAHLEKLLAQEKEKQREEEELRKKRLEQRKADMQEAIRLQEEEEKANKEAQSKASKQANIDLFKKSMGQSLDSLTATHNVDSTQVKALKASLEALGVETVDVATKMKQINAEFKNLKNGSTQITTATANMSLLEKEIVGVSERLKTGEISLKEYAELMKDLMFDANGNQTNAFINNVDIQNRIKYMNEYKNVLNTIAQKEKEAKATEEQQALLAQQKSTLYTQIEEQLKKIENIVSNTSKYDSNQYSSLVNGYNELRTAVESGNMTLSQARSRFQELGIELREFQQETRNANTTTGGFLNTLKMMVGIYSLYDVLNLGKRAISSMVSEVRTLDSALVELNKVSNLSDQQLQAYVNTAFEVSEAVGRLGSDVINATSDFVQMGYSVEEASKLAENALMYVNVGDLGSVDDATSTMISTMKAFNIEAENSRDIIDKINNMSNNFAISAEGIGAGLQRASSALASANNSIDETLALMSVGNQVVQDPETLANGLKTISMRIRGLSEDGEELESNMEEFFATYANGVKVLNSDGSFRSTFDILNDLGKEWDNLSDKSQAYLAETVAGKHRANIFLALMENAEDLDKALQTSQNSANSAVEENERYMDSIAGKISQMQTAWQSLASATINSDVVKGILDMTTGLIKLTEACGGLIPVIIGLASAMAVLKFADTAGGVLALINQIRTLTFTTEVATLAVKAFNIAKLGLIGGGIVAGVMAIGAGIKYIASSAERAEERINNLKTSITDLTQEKREVEQLAGTYENLSKKAELSEEEHSQLTSTMNQLKSLIPELNGYYDENGDFIITNTKALEDYIEAKKEQIKLDKEELAQESKNTLYDLDDSIQKQQELLAGAEEYVELMNKDRDGSISDDERLRMMQLQGTYVDIEYAQQQVEQGTKSIADSLVKYREKLIDVISVSEDWTLLTEEQKNAMKEVIAEGDYSFLKGIFDDAINGTENYINKLLELKSVQEILSNKSSQVKKTLADFGVVAKDTEKLKKSFQDITDGIGDLNSVLDDINNGNGITASSLEKIIETYPELLQYIDNENDLRDAIKSKMEEQKNKQQDIYNQMLASTDDYYHNVMLADEQWRNATQTNVENLFKELGVAYDGDIEQYANMEQAKAGITEQLINKLGESWSGYFNQMSTAMSNGTTFEEWIATQGDYENMSIAKAQALQEEWKKIQAVQQGVGNAFNGFEFKPITIELGGSGKSASKSSSSKDSYISSIYQEIVDEILKGGEDIEKAMAFTEEKLKNAQLVGNTELEKALRADLLTMQNSLRDKQAIMAKELEVQMKEMAKILSDTGVFGSYDINKLTEKQMAEVVQKLEKQINSANLSENDKEAERLEKLKSLIEDVGGVYLSTMEERRELSTVWWEENNEYIEMYYEQVDKTFEKAKEKIDESTRDIELQQLLYKEGSQQHIDLEKLKYQDLLKLQEQHRIALEKIKEKDAKLEGENAKAYLKLWYDTEKEKREMIRSINEQIIALRKEELEKQIDTMEEYQDAMEDIIDATVEMIKTEQNAKKKALKEELEGYKKIIDAKKEALKKEKDDKDYQTELSEKQTEITKIENKILELQNDNSLSAKKKRQEYEEELIKLKKELNDMQEEHALDSALDALDKEYDAFEETQNNKIDAIEDYLSQEGQLRQDAIKRIENDQEKLYKELLNWNRKYGTAIDSDITNAWNKAMEGMKAYGEGQNSVLTTIENIVAQLKQANEEIKTMNENSGVLSNEMLFDETFSNSPSSNSTVKPTGDAYQSLIDKVAPQMNRNSDAWGDADEAEKKRLASENEKLAKQIGAWKGADGRWYVQSNKKVVALKDLYPTYHTGGIVGGEAEAGLKSTEQFAKLLKGEVVSTESQMRQFLNVTYPKMLGITQGNSPTGITIDRFVDITVQGNLDTSVDLENIIKRASQKAIDTLVNTMSNMGVKGLVR